MEVRKFFNVSCLRKWGKDKPVLNYLECMCHYLDFNAVGDSHFEMDLKHAVLEDIMPKVRLAKRYARLIQQFMVKHCIADVFSHVLGFLHPPSLIACIHQEVHVVSSFTLIRLSCVNRFIDPAFRRQRRGQLSNITLAWG